MGRKPCGKRRKCLLPALSPFLTMFFKSLLFQGRSKSGLCGKELSVSQMTQFYFEKEENIVGKGENAGYQHFLLFPQMFS